MKKIILSAALFTSIFSNAQYVDMEKDATEFTLEETKNLQSLPGAPNIIYLNVTGYYVYKNSPENIAQVVRLWRQAAENFRAFNVNVTTRKQDWDNNPKPNSLFMNFNIHYSGGSCPLTMWGNGQSIGGQNCQSSAQFYSFSHEIGHGLGINHHWAPYDNVIGNGIKYVNIIVSKRDGGAYFSHWAKGMVNDGEAYEDDIQTISNKLGFRPDDHGDNINSATTLNINNETVSKKDNNGVISQDGEIDMFKFSTDGGPINLTIKPLKFYNNLHLKADLIDSEGNVIIKGKPIFHYDYETWPYVDPALQDEDELNDFVKQGAELVTDLEEGDYYIKITNSGYVDQWGDGYTSYSSLGYYEIEGSITSNPTSVSKTKNNQIDIFPNPTTGKLSFQNFTGDFNIYDVSGKLVLQGKGHSADLSHLEKGVYFIHLPSEGIKEQVLLK